MPRPSFQEVKVNRREFMAAAAVVGAATTLAGCTEQSAGLARQTTGPGNSLRVGILDAAYKKAWQRAEALVKKMTLPEKIAQTGFSELRFPVGTAPAIKRLGLPGYNYYAGEALHGLVRSGPVTSFPVPLALACSWNPMLALRVYATVSDEARAYNKKDNAGLSFYSPQTLNLHRDPRWGRCQEAPGEDPCLAGTWAVNVVKGMQGDNPNYLKTTACAKHFICNNTENDRHTVSASVDARSFWEYYTRAYRACVINGDVFTVMSAYNSINGIPCSADHFLLTTLLRNRWGFRGYVTSDCDAVNNIFNTHHYVSTLPQAVALAMQAGCDLNCGKVMPRYLAAAVGEELVSEADISRAVTRLLTVRVLLGELDPPTSVPYANISFNVVDSPAHRSVALQAARESIVLLKNVNNFLPLQKSQLKTVAVIGPMAGQCHLGGYSGSPFVKISPYDGIAEALGVKTPEAAARKPRPKSGQPVVVFKPGCSELGPKDETMFAEAVDAAKNADVVIMVCGVGEKVDSEGQDRNDIKLTGVQHELIQACYQANPKTVLVISSNNTVAVNWEQQHLPAIVSAIFAGQAQGTAIADVLFGDYNPGGKTCCTWYKSVDQLPNFHDYDISNGRTYMYFEGQPLYPFGYGLSYTTFRIGDLQLDSKELSETKAVKISCTVENTGALAGAEVVQLYIAAPKSPVKRPIKELVGFQRVELQPGESRKITFTLRYTAQALWYWHESQRKFILQPGRLKLTIGNSSSDMALTADIQLRACSNAKLGGPETLDAMAVPVAVS